MPQQTGAILLLYDVTDLARLDEMRSELVAVASHELQTPLTTLRMTLLMLQEASDVLPARQRELVATSLIGVEQLTETVHEFLDLTRIEAGDELLALCSSEPVSVTALLADVTRRAQRQADARSGSAFAPMLRRVCSRRLSAARTAFASSSTTSCRSSLESAPGAGQITISGRRSLSDNGIDSIVISVTGLPSGLSPRDFRSQIFDKFFRLEHQQPEGRPHAQGAGVGLYMCRQIVARTATGAESNVRTGRNGRGVLHYGENRG